MLKEFLLMKKCLKPEQKKENIVIPEEKDIKKVKKE